MESTTSDTTSQAVDLTVLETHPIVLFDGVCNLCNASVNFLIDRVKDDQLRFGSLQSESGQAILERFDLPRHDFDSMVVVDRGEIYTRSSAAIRISRYLKAPWSWGVVFSIVPRWLRDPIYSFVARNRYRWFGKSDSCRLPTPEERARFLSP